VIYMQELQAEADVRRAEVLAGQLASAARLSDRDPPVAQPSHHSDRGFASHQNGPVQSAADPTAGPQLHPPPQRASRGFAAPAHGWDRQDPVVQPAGPAASSSHQPQHAVGPPAPYVPLSMAAFLPPEVQHQQPATAPQPPRSQPAFAAPQPPQPSPSPGPGWGTAGIAGTPATGLSNGHGHGGSGGPFGGGLFGLSGGAFSSARQPQATDPPAASSAAAAEPALYTPFGGVGSAFGAVTLPPRGSDHMAPPVPLHTAFGALPGSVDLQSLWQPARY